MFVSGADLLRALAFCSGAVVACGALWMTGFVVMYDVEKHGWASVGGLTFLLETGLWLLLLWWLGFRADGWALRWCCALLVSLALFVGWITGVLPCSTRLNCPF